MPFLDSLFGTDPTKKLMDTQIELKMCQKQMERLHKKAEKEEGREKKKMMEAMQKGNVDVAKVYAENSIRKKNESLNYLRMSAKLDAIQSRIQSATAMKSMTKSMGAVVGSLDHALKSMDLEKIAAVMGKFEQQFEDLDVRTDVMEGHMASSISTSAPKDEIDRLMEQVAAEAGLELNLEMPGVDGVSSLAETQTVKDDGLAQRLAALRN